MQLSDFFNLLKHNSTPDETIIIAVVDAEKQSGPSPKALSLVISTRHLFDGIQAAGPRASFTVRAQFLEIYNEEVKDLLAPSAATRSIAIRECPDGQIIVTGGLPTSAKVLLAAG
jgi:hypothetical protein